MTNNKPTVTVAIPAYNEEANIGFILNDVLGQKDDGFSLEKVIVISDASTDRTADIVRLCSKQDSRVVLIEHTVRKGKAVSVNEVMEGCESDVLYIFDADIALGSPTLISEAVKHFDQGADLVSVAQEVVPPGNTFEKILYTSVLFKNSMVLSLNNGVNIYTCHGHSRALSRRLYKNFRLKARVGEDAYSYLYCKYHGYKCAYSDNISVTYKLPGNFSDHRKQSVRFFRSVVTYEDEFGREFVRREYAIPISLVFRSAVSTFAKYPLHMVLYLLLVVYMRILAIFSDIPATWDMSTSTKIVRVNK